MGEIDRVSKYSLVPSQIRFGSRFAAAYSVSRLINVIALIFLTVFFLTPAFVYESYAVIGLSSPDEARYGLWLPHVHIIDVALFVVSFSVCIYYSAHKVRFRLINGIMLFLVIGASSMLLQATNNFGPEYFDGILYLWRYAALTVVVAFVFRCQPLLAIYVLVMSMMILVLVSLGSVLLFEYEGVLSGRINMLGMGPNVSSDFALYTLAICIYYHKNNKLPVVVLFAVFVLCLMYIPMTGSRRALIGLVLLAFYWRVAILAYSVLLLLLAAVVFSIFGYDVFVLTENAVSVFRLINTISEISSNNFSDGRVVMYANTIAVIGQYPLGIGLSDWAIQTQLGLYGTGSHTHNFALQWYLKFGPLAVFPIAFLVGGLVGLYRRGFTIPVVIILVNILTGYGFWNAKYFVVILFVFFAVYSMPRLKFRSPSKDPI